jgi:iturin family lipopeptide synthetase A
MTHTAEFSPTGLIRDALTSRSDRALSALESRSAHSWMMALDRSKVLPEAAPSAVRLFVTAGAGAHVTDMDGARFIDICLGGGTQILGHTHPVVQQAIVAQSARGWQFDLPADGQLELARLVQAAGIANERVALCCSPTDAVSYAARVARAFTSKHVIAAFTGSQSVDDAVDENCNPAQIVLPYGHPAAIDQIRRRGHELAAVIVEAVRVSDPGFDRTDWLHTLAQVCRESGVLFILDERQTGFRLAYGGAQEVLGLLPDLAVYGKAVGGGLPLGAVAGRADILGVSYDTQRKPAYAGTMVSPMSVMAGTATLAYLLERRATLYPALNDAGRILAENLGAFLKDQKLPVTIRSAGSIFRIMFAPEFAAAQDAFHVLVLNRGVLMSASQRGFLSTAHNATDVAHVLQAFGDSLRDARADGLFAHAG